ncbi:hypothetical protein M430DRAFT_37972 [Amorphotheca resinae ATCC 22711]|uniref:Uncharacterized protein n=1 Tax=Amorphotheca resinae ATCC 22711 TaxID=857342 RepID=A0A2T3BCN0_AMORE|nr:hypothetical protein M430DRAFT_37972 [Amorphotheca resinae ATCC 22711]PSS27167.1 hypothetical protein M430DRAFT_37972 [Amorphotheca resinae ATCC 22711]
MAKRPSLYAILCSAAAFHNWAQFYGVILKGDSILTITSKSLITRRFPSVWIISFDHVAPSHIPDYTSRIFSYPDGQRGGTWTVRAESFPNPEAIEPSLDSMHKAH